MTREEFITHEISVWGMDTVFDYIDRGYEPVLLSNGRWSWIMPVITRTADVHVTA